MEDEVYEPTPPDLKKVELTETERMPRIIVIRHAESIANTEGVYQGQTYDTDLSELGVKQAEALGKRMVEVGVTKIISSPLRRTYQTALAISRNCGCEIEVDGRLIETNHGDWEGRKKEWIDKRFAEIYRNWMEKPAETVFPNGESFLDTKRRVDDFFTSFDVPENAALITHDNIVRIILAMTNGDDLNFIWNYDIEPAAINMFEYNRMGDNRLELRVLKINDTKHLEGLKADIEKHAL